MMTPMIMELGRFIGWIWLMVFGCHWVVLATGGHLAGMFDDLLLLGRLVFHLPQQFLLFFLLLKNVELPLLLRVFTM